MQQWIDIAKEHWKEFLPKKYAALEAQGQEALYKALYQAAEMTGQQMDQLQASGLSHWEAWEMTREEYLLLKPEPEVTAKLEAED